MQYMFLGVKFTYYVTVTSIVSILGDARLAKNVKNKVFSIDLVSNDPSVIACDMSQARTVFQSISFNTSWNLTTHSLLQYSLMFYFI